ncbi:MAG: sensor histidine kinase [Clostridia bacterium]|nr:sensor histidine kinase [Clostridia bacterium]
MNISIQITAQTLDFTGINEVQLGLAAANLLDSALEACQRVDPAEDRFIEVRLYSRGDMVVFEVLNSADGVYRRTDQGLLSAKEYGDHGHGYDQLQILV